MNIFFFQEYITLFNPGHQTGSTRDNSLPRGGPRGRSPGRGCHGRGSGRGSRQDPFGDALADTSVRDPAGLSHRVDPPYTLRRASRSQNQPSVISQQSMSSWLIPLFHTGPESH